jgi:hypothetical protein
MAGECLENLSFRLSFNGEEQFHFLRQPGVLIDQRDSPAPDRGFRE